MSLDTILAILSLAISIGGFISLFIRDSKIILVIVLCMLILLSAIGAYRTISHQQEIEYVSSQIVKCLSKNGPSTIEQLKLCVHHPNFSDLFESIDTLVRARKIEYEVREFYDIQRNSYQVGVYVLPSEEG